MSPPKGRTSRLMLIANPEAGRQTLKRQWESRIEPFLRNTLESFDFQFTTGKGDATLKTREALKDGYDVIVSMGGDGTLNEVVNGFFENGKSLNPKAELGILPFGSGGDFVRSTPIKRDYRQAVHNLIHPNRKTIDVGLVTFDDKKFAPRHFINIADAGLVATVMKRVNTMSRSLGPLSRYVSGSMLGFLDHANVKTRLSFVPRGEKTLYRTEVALTNLVVANGQYFGRGMHPAPKARLDDGFFDVVILKGITTLGFLTLFPQLYMKNKRLSTDLYESAQTKEIRLEVLDAKKTVDGEIDGETYGEGNMTFSILPKSLIIRI